MLTGFRKCRFFLTPFCGAATYIVHCLPCRAQLMTVVTLVPHGEMLKVICIRESFDMQEQQTSKNARLIGYGLGAIVAAIALAWKFFAR